MSISKKILSTLTLVAVTVPTLGFLAISSASADEAFTGTFENVLDSTGTTAVDHVANQAIKLSGDVGFTGASYWMHLLTQPKVVGFIVALVILVFIALKVKGFVWGTITSMVQKFTSSRGGGKSKKKR